MRYEKSLNEITIFKDRIEIYNPGAYPIGVTPEIFIEGNSRPVRRNPLITRTLYYSKDMESFATGLKRIYVACKETGCRVQFVQQMYGFVVIFYRGNNTQDNTQDRILKYCNVERGKKEIAQYMGYKDAKSFAKRYITPLCESKEEIGRKCLFGKIIEKLKKAFSNDDICLVKQEKKK